MLARIISQSFRRQRRPKLLAGAAITLGVAVATAMLAVAADIGDKMSRELRAYGANILVYPQEDTLDVEVGGVNLKPVSAGAFLRERDLPAIQGIFWRHNILGFAPFLFANAKLESAGGNTPVQVIGTYFSKTVRFGRENSTTGVPTTHPWWKVQGAWPRDELPLSETLVGSRLAEKLHVTAGDTIRIDGRSLRVTGILSTGGAEESAVVAPLAFVQQIAGQPGAVRQIYVSALTKPEDAFARRDPATMSPKMRDRWYCTPYANSISFQLSEAIPHSHAEQIRRVAQNEGVVLARMKGLMWLVALGALFAAALAVSAAMLNAMNERRHEIALMRAIGSSRSAVAALFLLEALLLAVGGGGLGFGLGVVLAQGVAKIVFGAGVAVQPALLPLIMLIAIAVVLGGSATVVFRASRLQPAAILRDGA